MNSLPSFSPSRQASSAFYSKVLGLFGLSILSTAIGVHAGYTVLAPIIFSSPITFYGVIIAELALVFTSRWWAEKEGLNYGLFALFTFLSGVTVVPVIASFAAEFGGYAIIARALFASTALFLAAGAFGATTKRSLTGFTGLLFMGLIGILIIGLLGIVAPWGNTMEMIYSGAGVLLFAAFAAVDMNRISKYPDGAYVHAAIALYLDMFNLFLYVLRLMGAVNRR